MRSSILWVVVAVTACDAGKLTCKDAVQKARATLELGDDETATLIGTCELHDWSNTSRACVAAAKTPEALQACRPDVASEQTQTAEAIAAMQRFADRMCQCHDTKCAELVSTDMTTWAQEQAKQESKPPMFDGLLTKHLTELGERIGRCMQQAMTPPPNPPTLQDD